MSAFERILRNSVATKFMNGCFNLVPFLERFTLLKTPWGQLRIHHFRRSDEDHELHDHPWSFVTFILAGGYHEQFHVHSIRRMLLDPKLGEESSYTVGDTVLEWRRSGPLFYWPRRWAHRVRLPGIGLDDRFGSGRCAAAASSRSAATCDAKAR